MPNFYLSAGCDNPQSEHCGGVKRRLRHNLLLPTGAQDNAGQTFTANE